MKTISTIVLIVIANALTVSAGPGWGMKGKGDGEGGGHKNREARMERIANKLDLTPEQRDQLATLREKGQAEMRPLQEALRDAREDTVTLMEADPVDRDAVMRSVVAEGAAYLALSKARAEHQLARREILGPEKAAQLGDMRRGWMEERGGPEGRGRGKDRY